MNKYSIQDISFLFKYLYKFIQLTYQTFKNKSTYFIKEGEITDIIFIKNLYISN